MIGLRHVWSVVAPALMFGLGMVAGVAFDRQPMPATEPAHSVTVSL